MNKIEKFEIIYHFKYFLDIIPIYSTNIQNKGIINFIAISFEAEQDYADKLLLLQNSQNILIQENGQNLKSDYFLGGILINKYCVKIKDILTQNTYSIYAKLNKFNKNIDNNIVQKFKLSINDTINLLKISDNNYNLIYSYENNYLLFLLNNSVYQIDFITGNVVTIYELKINIEKENQLSQYNI